MLLNPLTLHRPTSLQQAVALHNQLEDLRILAGGTFLIKNLKLLKKKGIKTPAHILSLQNIEELRGISQEKDRIIIKSMTRLRDLQDTDLSQGPLSILKTVIPHLATTPIRNMATIGGNLTCRYTWTEFPALMIGLEAQMVFMTPDGRQNIISAETFFQNQAQTQHILTEIRIPATPVSWSYQRVKKSPYLDIPLLSLMITTFLKNDVLTNTRVVINNGVNFARRDTSMEHFLNQKPRTQILPEEAWSHRDPELYTPRATEYKTHMFKVSLKKALSELQESAL